MANFPLPKGYQRLGSFPLDETEIFTSDASAIAYAISPSAYPGQKISVVKDASNLVDIYTILPDGSLAAIGGSSVNTTASNGLTAVGSDIQLGGTLTQDTSMSCNGRLFNISQDVSSYYFTTFPDSTNVQTGLQSDGKLIVCGQLTKYGENNISNIIRINTDGTLDASFNEGGTGFSSDGYFLSHTHGLVIDKYDNIYIPIIINMSYNGVPINEGIIKLLPDGDLDTSFITGSTNSNSYRGIYINPEGDELILIGEFDNVYDTSVNNLIKLDIDGSIDTSFLSNMGTGCVAGSTLKGVGYQSDNKIILTGENLTSFDGSTCDGIIRLNTDGTLDHTFVMSNGGDGGTISTVVIGPDDEFYGSGCFCSTLTTNECYYRFLSDGTLDVNFNAGNDGFDNVRSNCIYCDNLGNLHVGFTSTQTYNGIYSGTKFIIDSNGDMVKVSFENGEWYKSWNHDGTFIHHYENIAGNKYLYYTDINDLPVASNIANISIDNAGITIDADLSNLLSDNSLTQKIYVDDKIDQTGFTYDKYTGGITSKISNSASGDYGFSVGYNAYAGGSNTIAMGRYTSAEEYGCNAIGFSSKANTSQLCSAIGIHAYASAVYSYAGGSNTSASGKYALNISTGIHCSDLSECQTNGSSIIGGYDNQITGTNPSTTSPVHNTIIGGRSQTIDSSNNNTAYNTMIGNSFSSLAEGTERTVIMGMNNFTTASQSNMVYVPAIMLAVGSEPPSPEAGTIYFNSSTKNFLGFDGSTWTQLNN